MDLDENTRADLSAFFARRFPSSDARTRLAGAAGLPAADLPADAPGAWSELVARAVARGRLLALVDAAGAAAPGDPLLAEVRTLLAGPPARATAPGRARVALAVVGVTLGLVAAGFVVTGLSEDPFDAPDVAASVALGEELASPSLGTPGTPAPLDPPAAATPPAEGAPAPHAELDPAREPPVADPAPAAKVGVPPAEAAPPPASAAPPAPAPPATVAAAAPAPSGCAGPEGTIVGWWYTRVDPGAVGDTVTVPTHANVRVDFPRAENRYARGATVLCTLREGARQRLSHAPVHAGGGQWWVPLAGGDLGG